jgi:GT2 family glycosyltransferase
VSNARISVSIVIFDLDEPMLTNCLRSLEDAIEFCTEGGNISRPLVTIVDNGGNGASLNTFKNENIRVLANVSNVGYGSAHNQVIEKSTAEFHLIINADVIVDRHYISRTVQLMETNLDVVLVAPKGKMPNGGNAYLCKRQPSLLVLLIRGIGGKWLSSVFWKRIAEYECHDLIGAKPFDVELISGCCMFARTQALKDIGCFDEDFFLYFEDFDLSKRMQKAGRVVCLPSSKIIHYGGNSSKKGPHHIKLFIQSAFLFFQKHGWSLL